MVAGTDYYGLTLNGFKETINVVYGEKFPCWIQTGVVQCYWENPTYTSDNLMVGSPRIRVNVEVDIAAGCNVMKFTRLRGDFTFHGSITF